MMRGKAALAPQPRYYAREVKSLLDFAGDPTLAAAAGIDVAALDDPETTIPLTTYYELLERGAAITGGAHFGCRFARHWHEQARKIDRGAIGLLMLSSPNLRVMCEHLLRFQRYWNSGDVYEVEERGDRFTIRYRSWGPWREAHRHMAEKTVADIVVVVRAVEPAFQPLAVSFPHAANWEPCELGRMMSVCPTYGAAWTEVVLPVAVLDKELPTANSALFRLSERYLAIRSAEQPEHADEFTARVRRAVQRALAQGSCDQTAVARVLGCSARTLQRRLSNEGTTLRELVDEVRKERARALLESRKSIAEVGFELGYSEPAAFQHAFRRWYGVSPKAWAQKLEASVSR